MKSVVALVAAIFVVVCLTSITDAKPNNSAAREEILVDDPFDVLTSRMTSVMQLHGRRGRQVTNFLYDVWQVIYNFIAEMIVGVARVYSPRLADFTRNLLNTYLGTNLATF